MGLNYTIQNKKGCENVVANAPWRRIEDNQNCDKIMSLTEILPT
jgi:hypothetical protein